MNHLVIGKAAPDFAGENINNKTIKLTDYRGKIVLVYFCSISCGPCHELYPYWRSLVERMKAEPFVLIGINSDPPQKRSEIIRDEKITWPTLWEDYNQPASINAQWYVQGWPTIFLIDQQGIIRQHWFGSPGTETLDRQIQELLKEAPRTR
jgi:peroxiredoxin